ACVGSVVPTVPVCPSPPAAVICDAPAAVALMLNVTVVAVAPIVAVAVVVCVPINTPSVRNVCACPFTSVVKVVGSTDPPPDAAAHVTVTPATGFPFASRTITDGAISTAVPAVAVWPLPALMAICVAAPAVPVAVKVTGLPVSPVDVAVSEFGPAMGPKVHEVTSAIPLAFVVTGVVGVTEPPPDATANVTVTPATGLPFASCAITDGFTSTAVPAVDVWPSPALIAIRLATPAVPVAVKVAGLPVSPVA